MSAAPAFKLKFNGDRLKQYVSKLAKEGVDRVNKEMKLQIENEKFYEELEILASNIIWNEVYAVRPESPGYDRTYDLFNSPVAESAGLDITKVNVVLRGGRIQGTKKSMEWAGKYTYGWFFDHPKDSFLHESAMPHRPFMQILVNALRNKIKERVAMTAKTVIKKAIK